jgi:hypothetical protein
LKTWSYGYPDVERVQVVLATEGTPIDAEIELWSGSDETSCKMRVHSEDGGVYAFNAIIEMPSGAPSTLGIRNTGQVEFPFAAYTIANDVDLPNPEYRLNTTSLAGGAMKTYPSDPNLQSIGMLLRTDDGKPLNATLELHQGSHNSKQSVELYTDHGLERPLFVTVPTPGTPYNVRVVAGTAVNATPYPRFIENPMAYNDPGYAGAAPRDEVRW